MFFFFQTETRVNVVKTGSYLIKRLFSPKNEPALEDDGNSVLFRQYDEVRVEHNFWSGYLSQQWFL